MEISSRPPQPPVPTPTTRPLPALELAALKPGQQFTAHVIAAGSDGTLTLKLAAHLLKVVSELRLAVGCQLKVEVQMRGGEPALRLIAPPDDTAPETLQQGLRQLLPRQQPLLPLVQQLARLATATTARGTPSPLPPPLQQAIETLFHQQPDHRQLASPEGLRQAIANSGLFLEASLLKGGDAKALQGDLKAQLLHLAAKLRQWQAIPPAPPVPRPTPADPAARQPPSTPPQGAGQLSQQAVANALEALPLLQQLSRLTESALARLQVQQLTPLQAQQQGEEPTLTLELPILNGAEGEVLELQVRREAQPGGKEGEPCWSVRLCLDSDEHGAVRAVVTLSGGSVSTTFWCERPQTRQRFAQHLGQLRERLGTQGLEIGRTQALDGLPPEPGRPSANSNLINTRA